MYKVYKLYNDLNDIQYIGITSQKGDSRLRGKSSSSHEGRASTGNTNPLYCDIREFGIDAFHMVNLSGYVYSRSEALKEETRIINLYKSKGIRLYNIDDKNGDSARKVYFDKLHKMSKEERSRMFSKTINSEESKLKRGNTRRGTKLPSVTGKNHGRARSCYLPDYDKEFDTLQQATEFLNEYYPGIRSSVLCKILRGYTPKRYSGLRVTECKK